MKLPEEFLKSVYFSRREFVDKMRKGKAKREDIILEFMRHNAVVATYGPAGINAAPKGMSFPVKERYLQEFIALIRNALERGMPREEKLRLIFAYSYDPKKVDFSKLITLELAKKHTWKNLKEGEKEATILFYLPPEACYEVRCEVEIYEDGLYWEYANLIHAFYHYDRIPERFFPTYLFKIKEIYDNSERAFGKKIFP